MTYLDIVTVLSSPNLAILFFCITAQLLLQKSQCNLELFWKNNLFTNDHNYLWRPETTAYLPDDLCETIELRLVDVLQVVQLIGVGL